MPFLLAMVKCEGTEATLFSCVHSPVGAGPCDVGAGVVCQGEITINTTNIGFERFIVVILYAMTMRRIGLKTRWLSSHKERRRSDVVQCKKGKGSFYIAQYPVRWTVQGALQFLPSLTDLFIPTPTRLPREAF